MLRTSFSHIALVILLGTLFGLPQPAHARPHVVRSQPSDGAVLPNAPTQVQVWFSHGAVVELPSVKLVDAGGHALTGASPSTTTYQPQQVGLAEQFDSTYLYLCSIGVRGLPTVLSVALPPLPAGSYRLSWHALGSDDRSAASGALVFGVQPGAAQATSAAPASSSREVDGLLVTLAVSPNLPGENFLIVSVVDTRRPARAPVQQVALRLQAPGASPDQLLTAQPLGDGRFQLAGDLLRAAGDWGATITLWRPGRAAVSTELSWNVPASEASSPWLLWGAGVLALLGAASALWLVNKRSRAKAKQ